MINDEKEKAIERLNEIIMDIKNDGVDSFLIITKGYAVVDGRTLSVHNEVGINIDSIIHRAKLFLDLAEERLKSKMKERVEELRGWND